MFWLYKLSECHLTLKHGSTCPLVHLLDVKKIKQILYIISFPKSISGIEKAYQLDGGLNQDP